MYELLLGLGLLTNVAATEIQMPPECNDPQVIEMLETEFEGLPPWLKVKFIYVAPAAAAEESIGLRHCLFGYEMTAELPLTPKEAGVYYFDIQTVNGDQFVLRPAS